MVHFAASSFNGMAFEFREDGYFNMTKAAKVYGKRMDNFWKWKGVDGYMEALKTSLKFSDVSELTFRDKAGTGKGGTWAHPKLAVFFARWLDVEFAVWCDMVIDSLLRGQTTINIQVDTPVELLQVPETAGTLRTSATYAANMAQPPDSEEALHGSLSY
ncbi:KilA-N domain-containing protein [Chromobacterium haemolyticum]|uniref:KilA-N domain-containing protein n=1 Tax=Chromobacterium haemolyticum TaxID=394935 RepID=UPI000DEF02A1|nr:KilA-N domain-containing protein [Chromobacterium haemolyticum]